LHRTLGDERVRDMLTGAAAVVFNQDKVMIQAPQRVIYDTAVPQVDYPRGKHWRSRHR
jgi:hypothetical protein